MKRSSHGYRISDSCPWPERRGRVAYVLTPNASEASRYPFHGKARSEVVVWIEDDPLRGHPDGWSCVLDAGHLEYDA